MQYIATCKLGLESIVADELRALGASEVCARDARVFFSGGWDVLCRANINLRVAERVFLSVGSFRASTFDELFEGVRAIAWEDILRKDDAFPVKGKTAHSALHSVSDCQSIVKKAIVERLKSAYGGEWMRETGREYIVEVALLNDIATITLDASGVGLNRRGYRTWNAQAPLTETLAAALLLISRFDGNTPFLDPMCGSGTLPIEAAMIAQNIAPGRNRGFAAEKWACIGENTWKLERERANDSIRPLQCEIQGSDIDGQAIVMAKMHAKQAGLMLKWDVKDVKDVGADAGRGLIICNPPYGERLMDKKIARDNYGYLGDLLRLRPTWKFGIITSDSDFERYFCKRADKRRKVYNGGIPCQYYQYYTHFQK